MRVNRQSAEREVRAKMTSYLRAFGIVCVVLAATAVVAGCSSKPLPPAERPEVVWSDGKPAGHLDDDPRVKAVRAHDLELSIGRATRDFSNEAWGDTAVETEIGRQVRNAKEDVANGRLVFPPGPTPMIPVYIDENSDGSAEVLMCKASPWSLTAERPEPEFPLRGWFTWYTVIEDGGHLKVDHISAGQVEGSTQVVGEEVIGPFLEDREDSDCILDDAKIGLFDPQPDVTIEYGPEDIKVTDSAG